MGALVLQYKYANDSRKSYSEKGVNDTFEIIKNGPNISNCEELLKLPDKKENFMHIVLGRTFFCIAKQYNLEIVTYLLERHEKELESKY